MAGDKLKALIQVANRQNGNWLPDVDKCVQRAQPCGNAYCLDEAMRAAQVQDAHASTNALSHAHKIANNCEAIACPADKVASSTGGNRHTFIDDLSGM